MTFSTYSKLSPSYNIIEKTWPYDALRKVGPLGVDKMEMWDVPFDTNTNNIHIAFDSDFSLNFSGFVLNFWFKTSSYDYADVQEALDAVLNQFLAIIR